MRKANIRYETTEYCGVCDLELDFFQCDECEEFLDKEEDFYCDLEGNHYCKKCSKKVERGKSKWKTI